MTTDTPAPITIAVAGYDDPGVARALRCDAGVTVEPWSASEDGLLALFARPEIAAVAFCGRVPDLPGAIRRTLLSGRHAFVATPVALASKQIMALDAVARRRARVLLFEDGASHDERIAFVRRMTSGPNAIWRPRYLRSLHTGAHGDTTIDEMAITAIVRVLAVAGATAERASALSARTADDDAPDAAMLTLIFEGGIVARIDVSLTEPALADEMTVACDGRTIRLDAFDLRAPLQIHASARHHGPQSDAGWMETVSEHPITSLGEQSGRAARAFVAAARANDAGASNAGALAEAAVVWETARASMARGGEMLDVPGAAVAMATRPSLQVIRGGGHTVEDAPAPALRVVARGAGAAVRALRPIDDDGPRSA
jgi:predicted dehydrogenase